jgi:hypothetical protein
MPIKSRFAQLVVNARDAVPDRGTLSITAEAATPRSGIGLDPGTYIRLSAAETGHGMNREILAKGDGAVLFHQGARQGDGSRPVDGARARGAAPWLATSVERGR